MSIKLKILFFAKSRELVGRTDAIIEVPNKLSYEDLFETVVKQFNLEPIKSNILLALNEEFCCDGEIEIKTGDELAVIPPLSGG